MTIDTGAYFHCIPISPFSSFLPFPLSLCVFQDRKYKTKRAFLNQE